MIKFNIWPRQLSFNPSNNELKFEEKTFSYSSRNFWQMSKLYPPWAKLKDEEDLYFMYRDVYFSEEDREKFRANNLRYDITVISPLNINWECNKTFGHYHPLNKDSRYYQEIYEVLYWSVIYLQQNDEKVFYTKAKKWEQVIMQESFWHISINPSEDFIIMANIVSSSFQSIYSEIEKKHGWAYKYIDKKRKHNNNYPKIEIFESFKKEWYNNIYDDFLQDPSKFNYLH